MVHNKRENKMNIQQLKQTVENITLKPGLPVLEYCLAYNSSGSLKLMELSKAENKYLEIETELYANTLEEIITLEKYHRIYMNSDL